MIITDVRREALKPSTIRKAFKATGLVPFMPAVVLDPIRERLTRDKATPEPTEPCSSTLATPITERQILRVSDSIFEQFDAHSEWFEAHTPGLRGQVMGLVHGAVSLSVTEAQHKNDLSRTRHAEEQKRIRQREKNSQIRFSGVLSIESGREMVSQRAKRAQELQDRRDLTAYRKA